MSTAANKQSATRALPNPDPIRRVVQEIGVPAYRARQVLRWIYNRRAQSFDEMTDLPAELRTALAERIAVQPLKIVKMQTSQIDDTSKFLFELPDGNRIESVFLRDGRRKTACISTQVGCALACRFCATGKGGFIRDLSPAEIVHQVLAMERARERVTSIVFMGMGEALLNTDAVIGAIEILTSKDGLGLSSRRITVSTSGIVPGIKHLAESPVKVNLAWSLNSPFNDERSTLMPVNKRYPIEHVIEALKDYTAASGREVSVEYIVIKKLNMSRDHAEALAEIAGEIGAKVNLISCNPVEDGRFATPSPEDVVRFRNHVKAAGAFATIRFRRGRDIAAACGQLRARS
ncbi:MAG: 23S rRNA (adenine(2503)-C(2))-methyltransferase RlmN [Planctomycetes bacterium]|nr:23S rRNA (adenine(2503)-C(2))-methyltransferase RlmN [Planctomycetota bacterium]